MFSLKRKKNLLWPMNAFQYEFSQKFSCNLLNGDGAIRNSGFGDVVVNSF